MQAFFMRFAKKDEKFFFALPLVTGAGKPVG